MKRVWCAVAVSFAALTCLTLTCGAQSPAGPPPSAALFVVRIEAPPIYRQWYTSMERCVGVRGDFSKVVWDMTPHPWVGDSGKTTYGLWLSPHRIIVNRDEMLDSTLVSHEIVHDLLATHHMQSDTDAHPAMWFGDGKCARRYHP